jgi:hypothetical protein
MKHLAFKIGDMFLIRTKGKNGKPDDVRVCRKSSRIGFVYADEAMLGEVQFDPELDAKVEAISAAGNVLQPPSAVAALNKPIKRAAKKAVKKAKKKAVKK